jgi:hypothetical protein
MSPDLSSAHDRLAGIMGETEKPFEVRQRVEARPSETGRAFSIA